MHSCSEMCICTAFHTLMHKIHFTHSFMSIRTQYSLRPCSLIYLVSFELEHYCFFAAKKICFAFLSICCFMHAIHSYICGSNFYLICLFHSYIGFGINIFTHFDSVPSKYKLKCAYLMIHTSSYNILYLNVVVPQTHYTLIDLEGGIFLQYRFFLL